MPVEEESHECLPFPAAARPEPVISPNICSAGGAGHSYDPPEQSYALPEQSYGAPEQSYGVPEQSYSVPEQSYGVPEQSYGVPEQSYGVPEQSYGVQEQSYGTQEQSYGTQEQSYGPSDTYGSVDYSADYTSGGYESAASYQPPGGQFGAPDSYGAALGPLIQDNYGRRRADRGGGGMAGVAGRMVDRIQQAGASVLDSAMSLLPLPGFRGGQAEPSAKYQASRRFGGENSQHDWMPIRRP